MGAKSRLLLLLVASLIGVGFALIPATEAETSHQVDSILHQNAKNENHIEISIQNDLNQELPCSLAIDVFSEDLQEQIEMDSSNLVFSINGLQTYYTNFSFTIPRSGNYSFNLTLLSNNDGEISSSSIEYEYLFYDNLESNLKENIIDYYLDDEDNANWIFNEETNNIELINLENEYEAGIVLGPYNTKGNKNNILILEQEIEKTNTAQYTISYTKNFNRTQLYSTTWNELYLLDNNSPQTINLGLEDNSEIYIRLLASDSEANSMNYWNVINITHKYVTIKHDLNVNTQEHYFFEIDANPEFLVNIENIGLFDQQLGNITISVELYGMNGKINSYLRTPNLPSGENQEIDFRFTDLLAGNYYCTINIILIEEKIYKSESITLFSISTTNLDNTYPINSNFERLNLLIETETIEDFTLDVNYQSTKLIANYFLIEIETDETIILNPSNYRLISAISMDENRFSIILEEESDMTIEGIIAPSIEFETLQTYSSSITINNEGFYSENYQISYFFTSTFIQSLSGPEIISISPGTSSSFVVDILPLSRIPRGGGSLLYIEIADQYNSERATFVLSYSETKIDVVEQSCNRHSVLLGQDIVCKSTITNKGYVSDSLTINVIAMNEKGLTEIVDQINLDKLEFQESLVMRTTYFPKTDNNFQMIIEINSNGELLTSSEIPDSINVVTAANEPKTETNLYNAPKIEMSHTVFAISFAGIAFQFRRSENFKYFTFKFFIPMYSRLQKDTLADEPTRQRLLTTIYTEPGSNFTLLKEKLGLHNGTLAHHLNILESNQMIASHRSGRQRLFFPYGSSNNSNIRNSMITNPTQKNIIQIVKENPGITQSMISQQLGMSRQKINYHVNSLSNNSILKVERQGRITRLYPMHFT